MEQEFEEVYLENEQGKKIARYLVGKPGGTDIPGSFLNARKSIEKARDSGNLGERTYQSNLELLDNLRKDHLASQPDYFEREKLLERLLGKVMND